MSGDDRKVFIENTEKFIEEQHNWLENILRTIGWSINDLSDGFDAENAEIDYIQCPIKPEHRMPKSSLEKHLVKCEKKHGKYPEITDVEFSTDTSGVTSLLQFPSCDEKGNKEEAKDVSSTKEPDTSKDLAELLKAERDAKRRRAAHRGKKVHSNKKTYCEMLREIIANEMQSLSIGQSDVENKVNVKTKCDVKDVNSENPTYLGLGDSHYRGNPYKRWMTVEEEEARILKDLDLRKRKHDEDDLKRDYKERKNKDGSGSRCGKFFKNKYNHETSSYRKRFSRSPDRKRIKFDSGNVKFSDRLGHISRNRKSTSGNKDEKWGHPLKSVAVSEKSNNSEADYIRHKGPRAESQKLSTDRTVPEYLIDSKAGCIKQEGSTEDPHNPSIDLRVPGKVNDLKTGYIKCEECSGYRSKNHNEEEVESRKHCKYNRHEKEKAIESDLERKHKKRKKKNKKHKHKHTKSKRKRRSSESSLTVTISDNGC